MNKYLKIILFFLLIVFVLSGYKYFTKVKTTNIESVSVPGVYDPTLIRTDEQWRQVLTKEQYRILRESGTETPFSGALNNEKRKGTYYSVGCNQPIYRSEQKFESGTGWPSFWDQIEPDTLVLRIDNSLGVSRVEVLDKCGSHLGHVFDDGPMPSGKRYCMNSTAMYFVPDSGL